MMHVLAQCFFVQTLYKLPGFMTCLCVLRLVMNVCIHEIVWMCVFLLREIISSNVQWSDSLPSSAASDVLIFPSGHLVKMKVYANTFPITGFMFSRTLSLMIRTEKKPLWLQAEEVK